MFAVLTLIGFVPTKSESVSVMAAGRNAPANILYLPPVNARRPAIEERIVLKLSIGETSVPRYVSQAYRVIDSYPVPSCVRTVTISSQIFAAAATVVQSIQSVGIPIPPK